MAWNEVETLWFLIYTGLVYQLPRPVAEAIFKRQATGHAQRQLIMAIAAAVFKDDTTGMLEFLKEGSKDTNELANERNDLIHGDYHYGADEHGLGLYVAPGGDRSKGTNRFAGPEMHDALMPLIGDIERVSKQLEVARHHLIWNFPEGPPPPLPASMPDDVRQMWLRAFPELQKPTIPLIWQRVRPTAGLKS